MRDIAEIDRRELLFLELRGTMARSAIMASLLLNGAAAIVVLSLLGDASLSEATRTLGVNVSTLKLALMTFGLGAVLAAATFVNAYLAQGAFAGDAMSTLADRLRRLGLALIVISLLLFLAGLWLAADGVSGS